MQERTTKMAEELSKLQQIHAHLAALGFRRSSREVPRIHLPRLSEKGFEQRSERGFCQYMEGEMGQTCLLSGS